MSPIFSSAEPGPQLTWTAMICTICTDNYSNAVVVYTLNTTTGMGMFVTHVSGIRVSFMG